MNTYVLQTEWNRPPLSLNDSGNWRSKSGKIAAIRATAAYLARAAKVPPLEHVVVRMIWVVPDRRRRDAENPVATLKPFCDGLVDAGVVADDVPALMTKLMPEIRPGPPGSGVRFELTATTLGVRCPLCGFPLSPETTER